MSDASEPQIDLLPCPFDAGDAYLAKDKHGKYMVSCGDCYCIVGEGWDQHAEADYVFGTAKDAAAAWNTRPSTERS